MPEISERIDASVVKIKSTIGSFEPTIGLILGSGLGNLAEEIISPVKIKYKEIGFPVSTVEGHAGQLVLGELQGKKVIAMQGRSHFYEGHSLEEITLPVRVMKMLGVKTVIITNAAGGVNKAFKPGDLMLLNDHINFSGHNPLRGKNLDEFGARFPDLTYCYDKELIKLAGVLAKAQNCPMHEGVYCFSSGPSYETPAEVNALRMLGVSAVGMSTVPEAIAAVHSGMKVLGISCITNMAAGVLDQKLDHAEVIETCARVNEKFIKLLKGIIGELS